MQGDRMHGFEDRQIETALNSANAAFVTKWEVGIYQL
jgi:hypothetical protein